MIYLPNEWEDNITSVDYTKLYSVLTLADDRLSYKLSYKVKYLGGPQGCLMEEYYKSFKTLPAALRFFEKRVLMFEKRASK